MHLFGNKYGLDNSQAGAFMQLVWQGTHLLPRVGATVIKRTIPVNPSPISQHYRACVWWSPFTAAWDSGDYSVGFHPYPATDGTVDASGVQLTGNGLGPLYWWEVAGNGNAIDTLCTAGGTGGRQVQFFRAYTQVIRTRLNGSNYEARFFPDYFGDPTFEIVCTSTHVPGSGASPANPAFYFGASDWQTTADYESPNEITWGWQLYSAYLSDADVAVEARNGTINAAMTSNGQANLHYINQFPTPTDITDKKPSGTLHTPSWANANRPTSHEVNMPTIYNANGTPYRRAA